MLIATRGRLATAATAASNDALHRKKFSGDKSPKSRSGHASPASAAALHEGRGIHPSVDH